MTLVDDEITERATRQVQTTAHFNRDLGMRGRALRIARVQQDRELGLLPDQDTVRHHKSSFMRLQKK